MKQKQQSKHLRLVSINGQPVAPTEAPARPLRRRVQTRSIRHALSDASLAIFIEGTLVDATVLCQPGRCLRASGRVQLFNLPNTRNPKEGLTYNQVLDFILDLQEIAKRLNA